MALTISPSTSLGQKGFSRLSPVDPGRTQSSGSLASSAGVSPLGMVKGSRQGQKAPESSYGFSTLSRYNGKQFGGENAPSNTFTNASAFGMGASAG